MDKKIILIDMDEVIIEKFMLKLYNEFTGHNRSADSFTKQYIQEELNIEEKNKFFEYLFTRKNVYDNVALMEDAAEIMPKLNEKYSLFICTDFLIKEYELRSDKMLVDKFEILKKLFPYISPTQYIFARAKKLIAADIIIDDRPQNFGEHHKQCLLYTAYHNKNMSDAELKEKNITRVNSWKEIEKLLF